MNHLKSQLSNELTFYLVKQSWHIICEIYFIISKISFFVLPKMPFSAVLYIYKYIFFHKMIQPLLGFESPFLDPVNVHCAEESK